MSELYDDDDDMAVGGDGRRVQLPVVPGYVLTHVLGRGASSVVYGARSCVSGERLAVKVTSETGLAGEDVRAMAIRERTILERVTGEHLVRLRECLPMADGEVAFVLDLADGGSLQDLVAVRGALPPGEVVTVMTPLASTLGELHAAGVIHADLAPANVLFTGDGRPLLGDLGAARLAGEQRPRLVAGTPGFVAPEVRRGGLPTPASDVWSLGALLWYAVTGGSLPPATDPERAAAAVVGPVFAAVLAPMLASDPEGRPRAADLAVPLYQCFPPSPIRLAGRHLDAAVALTHRIRQQAALEPPEGDGETGHGQRKGCRSRLVPAVVVGLLVALVLAGVASTGLLSVSPPTTVSAPSFGSPQPQGKVDATAAGQAIAHPGQVLQSIADVRARALMEADTTLLRDALADASAAYVADVHTLAALRATGERWVELSYTVRSAELVSSDGSGAQVRAVVDLGPYTVVGPDGGRRRVPAQSGDQLTYLLEPTGSGWRLSGIATG